MQTDRIQQGASDNLQVTLSVGPTPTNPAPDSATVGVTRADGSILIAAGTAATDTGTGTFSVALTPAQTALLDRLTATWTFTYAGQLQTRQTVHEIVGGYIITLSDLQAVLPDATTAELTTARLYAEDELERAVGYAFVPRYARQTIIRRWRQAPHLTWPYVRAIRSVTIDGTAITGSDLAAVMAAPGGLIGGPFGGTQWMTDCFDGWYGPSWSTVTVGYEHGLDYPPPGAQRAALTLAQDYQGGDTSIDSRAESIVTVDGTVRLRTGGQYGLPAVDSFIAASRLPVLA